MDILDLQAENARLIDERDWLRAALKRHQFIVAQTLLTATPWGPLGLFKVRRKLENIIYSLNHFQKAWQGLVLNDLEESATALNADTAKPTD